MASGYGLRRTLSTQLVLRGMLAGPSFVVGARALNIDARGALELRRAVCATNNAAARRAKR